MAIKYGYNGTVRDISVAEAKNRLPELIRAVESGEQVIITRHGKPVAQISPPPARLRKVRLGTMRDSIQLNPGWDKPINIDDFLTGEF